MPELRDIVLPMQAFPPADRFGRPPARSNKLESEF
jgi:hypothetical protein